MKNKKILLGILIGLSFFGIAAMKYGDMDAWGLLKVDEIQHLNNASGVYIESVQMINNTVRANAFYAGNTELINIGDVLSRYTVYINMITRVPDAIGQGTWDRVQQSTHLYGGLFRNALAAANGDNFSVNFSVPAGTYRIDMNTVKGTNKAIIDVIVNSTTVQSAYDLYSATDVVTDILSITGVSLTSGSHTLKILVNGKNTSSSAYVINITGITITRTGD